MVDRVSLMTVSVPFASEQLVIFSAFADNHNTLNMRVKHPDFTSQVQETTLTLVNRSYPVTLTAGAPKSVTFALPWPNLELVPAVAQIGFDKVEVFAIPHSTENPCPMLELLSRTWADTPYGTYILPALSALMVKKSPPDFTDADLRQVFMETDKPGAVEDADPICERLMVAVKYLQRFVLYYPDSASAKRVSPLDLVTILMPRLNSQSKRFLALSQLVNRMTDHIC